MFRRQYVALLGAGTTVGLAGCASGDGTGDGTDNGAAGDRTGTPTAAPESTPTATQTAEPTATETPTPEPPEVLFVNLVSSWESFGDAVANQISSVPTGSDVRIAWRELTWVHDGEYNTTAQVEIFDSGGERVAIRRNSYEQFVEGSGPQEWEGWVGGQADWPPGEYTAEVIVRDNVIEEASASQTGTFTITESESLLEIISESRYSGQYDAGVRGVAKNVSEETLSYAEVSAVFFNDAGQQIGDGLDNTNNLAAGREWQFDCALLDADDFASYELSVDWRM